MRWAWVVLAGCGGPAWSGDYVVDTILEDSCYGIEVGEPLSFDGAPKAFTMTAVAEAWDCAVQEEDETSFHCTGPTDGGQSEAGAATGTFTLGEPVTVALVLDEVFATENCHLAVTATQSVD